MAAMFTDMEAAYVADLSDTNRLNWLQARM